MAVTFIVIYGIFMLFKYTNQSNSAKVNNESNQIIFKQPKLKFFEYTVNLNVYPDKVLVHYPYLLVIRPDQFRSGIYNIETRRKEKEINEIVIDYFQGDIVYNKQGFQTFFNKKDLGLLCDQAFIKSKTEILCITRPDQNKQNNKLISINPETLEQKDLYSSQNVLTAVYFEKNTLYIGEYDFIQNKAFVTVNNKTAQAGDLVNIFYPMGNTMYIASFKSKRNNMTESYAKIFSGKDNVQNKLIDRGEIVLHQ